MKVIQLTRGQVRAITMKLLKEQGGTCTLCTKVIDTSARQGVRTDYVLDHCHTTGRVRGVLCRGCNGAEGRVTNAVARWGGVGTDKPEAVLEYLQRLVQYLQQPLTNMVYPGHKTEDERKEAARIKRNKAAALRRAMQKAKEIGR